METRGHLNFVASDVPLSGSNLIEASAGTGKTYSIAILVLRLILEQKLSIKKILMVTFTKAAVAELEERIRLFVRTAYRCANKEKIDDQTIRLLVERSIGQWGDEEVIELLKEAKLLLDETSVMTIHSFCQKTLNEFAFETNQLFGAETLQDTSSLIQDEVNKFWRERITTLNPGLLKFLNKERFKKEGDKLSRKVLKKFIETHLNGQRYIDYDPQVHYSFPESESEAVLTKLLAIEEEEKLLLEDLYKEILDSANELIERCNSNSYAQKNVLQYVHQPEAFLKFLKEKSGLANIIKVFPDWLEKIEEANVFQNNISRHVSDTLNTLYCLLIQDSIQHIIHHKDKNNVLSFNDMIEQLHRSLTKKDNEKLVAELQEKYSAVFIDEFQDTDKLQYEIFRAAFGQNTTLFYIGDPKQSIYAWRQADLNTYFKASNEVDTKYGMNHNYRSSAPLIEAMNLFFKPSDDFDTFYYQGEKEGIVYHHVDSPGNGKGALLYTGQIDFPITIIESNLADERYQAVVDQIIQLLDNNDHLIERNGEKRRIEASDIGILVRSNIEGKKIKSQLAKRGIPAITIDDSKVLQSQESVYVYHLLNAFRESNIYTINKALLNPLTGYNRIEILQLDQDAELENFKRYGLLWKEAGIYVTLMQFIIDYGVKRSLLNDASGNGKRIITNIYQLIEILHKVQSSKNFSQTELINWLKRGLEGMKLEGDEFEQRIESDEKAIEIVTIHKSKGLEYNIVFAPFLDLKSKNDRDFCSFKNDSTGEYLFGITENLSDEYCEMVERQIEQENRRLIYVAITRAVYKCYIGHLPRNQNTSLSPFIKAVQPSAEEARLINFSQPKEAPRDYQYSKSAKQQLSVPSYADKFILNEKYWRKLSYSSLAKKPIYVKKKNDLMDLKDYESFIFKKLQKGNITGNLLHHIFENIDFTNDHSWERNVHASLIRFLPRQLENYKASLIELIGEVLHAKIEINDQEFRLSELTKDKRLNELEFDFNVPAFNTQTLNSLSTTKYPFSVNSYGELEGIMNGKMDLFFEHKGLFYILDWKSNFLGDSLDFYSKEVLDEVMIENNYHLQYLIYTVAAKKYLEQRMPTFDYESHFGGVIYLFVRGLRKDSNSGIFVRKPELAHIKDLENLLSYSYK
ncbi:UvrD-helicase domain-containing protein [Albibacterium sp.]|uniref:UvrD-helicase domain-containing protein n=1 Tax=Albibacterium sp. TaxID=2952885 RepID=UPI002BCA44B0|nr:UvrD-helicase domain-containing protein [Albibacterium sp.]HUH18739.1 UvrD-helicase domain-containing protein [Albibacterium sp.]